MRARWLAWVLSGASALSVTAVEAGEPPALRPAAGPIEVEGTFGFTSADPDPGEQADEIETLRRAASGIACGPAGACLVVFDEGAEARFVTLDGDRIVAEKAPVILAAGGEVDSEGAAFEGLHFYVTGSHSVKRNGCGENRASRVVLRAAADPTTGRPSEPFVPADLWAVMQQDEHLAGHLGGCLDAGEGVDIEAMAAAEGRLYFGFRGPTEDGFAPILSVDAAALFGGGDIAPRLDRVEVGARRGLRDMAAVDGGFLLLAGPDDDPEHADAGWAFLRWDGEGPETVRLGEIDLSGVDRRTDMDRCDDDKDRVDRKPEAVHADAGGGRVLVLSDGLCDGGPMWFEIPRAEPS